MTRLIAKRMIFVGFVLAASSSVIETSGAPIRSAASRSLNQTPRQRALTRVRANRAIRLASNPGNRVSAATFSGLRGAGSLSLAAQTLGQSTTTAATTGTVPTLYQVWEALAPTMRYASLLQPDPVTGLLPDSAFVADLQARRLANQLRFDTYHPLIAQLMDWDDTIRPSGNPSGPRPPGNPTNPQVVVPEPSTILISLSGIVFVIWQRRSRK